MLVYESREDCRDITGGDCKQVKFKVFVNWSSYHGGENKGNVKNGKFWNKLGNVPKVPKEYDQRYLIIKVPFREGTHSTKDPRTSFSASH